MDTEGNPCPGAHACLGSLCGAVLDRRVQLCGSFVEGTELERAGTQQDLRVRFSSY